MPAAVFIAVSVLAADSMTHHIFVETTVSSAGTPVLSHFKLVPVKFSDLFVSLRWKMNFCGNSPQLYLHLLSLIKLIFSKVTKPVGHHHPAKMRVVWQPIRNMI